MVFTDSFSGDYGGEVFREVILKLGECLVILENIFRDDLGQDDDYGKRYK